MNFVSEHEVEREVRRLFRRFMEPESYAARAGDGVIGLFVARNNWRRPIDRIGLRLWAAFERRDLVCRIERPDTDIAWRPSEMGIAYWRRLQANVDPFRSQHQLHARRLVSEAGETFSVEVNDAETSLSWLRRRKGADGKPLVSTEAFEAGEKLRADFTLAQMSPRVTTDWSLALAAAGGNRKPRDPAEISDKALAARQRLARALDAVGPGLSEILIEVCCRARGLEESERNFGWPQRSAKVVLQIALERLAIHYGMKKREGAPLNPAGPRALPLHRS